MEFPGRSRFPSPHPEEQPLSMEGSYSVCSSSDKNIHMRTAMRLMCLALRFSLASQLSVIADELQTHHIKWLLSFSFRPHVLTEQMNALSRYLQRRVRARGLENSFTSGVPYRQTKQPFQHNKRITDNSRHLFMSIGQSYNNNNNIHFSKTKLQN